MAKKDEPAVSVADEAILGAGIAAGTKPVHKHVMKTGVSELRAQKRQYQSAAYKAGKPMSSPFMEKIREGATKNVAMEKALLRKAKAIKVGGIGLGAGLIGHAISRASAPTKKRTGGNRYLEKAAAIKRERGDGAREIVAAGVGAHFVSEAPSKLMGYHNMYHGTSKENAKNILKNGLNKAHGGTRGSKVGEGADRNHFTSQAKKYVYMTKSKNVARTFAGDSAKHINEMGLSNPMATVKSVLDGFKNGKVLKARVSHNQYEKGFKMDPDSFTMMDRMRTPHEHLKHIAARNHRDIGSNQFVGGEGSKGIRSFLGKKHLKRYYGSASGKSRAIMGAAQLVGGSALIGGAGLHHKNTGGHFSKEKK